MTTKSDTWSKSDPYEFFMGRWSAQMAPVFLQWLQMPAQLSWLDLGCGTGALSVAISNHCDPAQICCVEPSAGFLEKAKQKLMGKTLFLLGEAAAIPVPGQQFDVVASALALNFFPNLSKAFDEIKRVLKTNGTFAAYVWDYAGRMDFLRIFWDAAIQNDPAAATLDEGIRFPICNAERLEEVFREMDFTNIETTALDIETRFINFADYWNPFLGGQGPAPGYLATLDTSKQEALKKRLKQKLTINHDGSFTMLARAIAVRGKYTGK